MKKLSNTDYQLFKSILSLDQKGLSKVLKKYLKKKYDDVRESDAYLYAVGNIPVALVAHMDTVFDKPPKSIYYDKEQGVMWSPDGLGADDRAGVFAILNILSTTDLRPSVIFTTDEEMGGIGAKRLASEIKAPIYPINFFIELDRCGINDCVFYDGDNSDFVDFIEDFGFSEAWGSFSDISVLSPAWQILGVNLSIGYDDEHSYSETLKVPHMLNTIQKVKKILSLNNFPQFEYREYKYWKSKTYSKYDDTLFFTDYIEECDNCGALAYTYEMIPVKTIRNDNELEYLCAECAEKEIDWCIKCGNPYLVEESLTNMDICPYCATGREKL